ncbi:conserved oligomeric Golgi complex component [Rhizophlyctis rosea]|uniref:Conserved oligomeric Golgi complex subunit 8 n=1 Tax=Rhizophlyctis rosea TaxID=64517 RepID=A0AAD5X4J4_9FUNG|nr:conserved oligomeric Golgi complex component [Rhizophlyctis rosea]
MLVETAKSKAHAPLQKGVSFKFGQDAHSTRRRPTYSDVNSRKQSQAQLVDADRRPSSISRQSSTFEPSARPSPIRPNDQPETPTSPQPPTPTLTSETFADTDYAAYLNRLASLSLEALRREPVLLAEESRQANSQLSALAFSEYRSFLTANASTQDTRTTLDSLDDHLDALDAVIPQLNTAFASFGEVSAGVLRDRKRISTILSSQQTWLRLLELLEIPQLHETFIRTGCYGEAMELQSHVNRLASRHPNFALVQSVAQEVTSSAQDMLSQLIALLKGNVKLPLCLTVIGYLKKMNVFTDAELRITFLQQRAAFFRDLINDIKETDSADYLKTYVELSRIHFTEIIVQYRNIFADSVHLPLTSDDTQAQQPTDPFHTPTPYTTQSILSSYVTEMIQKFLDVLDTHLPQIDSCSTISSLLTETMYYGMSLGRVGVDFRPVLASGFEDAVERIVRGRIDEGVEAFGEWCGACGGELKGLFVRFGDGVGGRGELLRTVSGLGGGGVGALTTSVVAPPLGAMEYPPFARLVNAFFGAWNELRLVPVVGLLGPLLMHVEGSLGSVAMYLAEVGDVHGDSWGKEEEKVFTDACEFFATVVVPSLVGGLKEGIYGSVKEGGGTVDVGKMVEPLKKWLPKEQVASGGDGSMKPPAKEDAVDRVDEPPKSAEVEVAGTVPPFESISEESGPAANGVDENGLPTGAQAPDHPLEDSKG